MQKFLSPLKLSLKANVAPAEFSKMPKVSAVPVVVAVKLRVLVIVNRK